MLKSQRRLRRRVRNSRKTSGGPSRMSGAMRLAGGGLIPRPPPLGGYEITHGVTVRFVANAAVAQAFTFQNLLDTFLVAASTVAGYDVFYSVRIRRISIWSAAALGSASTVNILYAGATAGSIGDQVLHTGTSMGIEPAYVVAVPNAFSLCANFQLSSASTAFDLYCPNGSVVDVSMTLRGAFVTQLAAQNAIAGTGVAGVFYLRGLDGLAIAATKLPPVYAQAAI